MSFKLTLGKTTFAGRDLFTNEAICALVLKDEYNTAQIKEYLYHILPHLDYAPYAQRATKGSTLNKDSIPTIEIPFPKDEAEWQEINERLKRLSEERKELEQRLKQNALEYEDFIKGSVISA